MTGMPAMEHRQLGRSGLRVSVLTRCGPLLLGPHVG